MKILSRILSTVAAAALTVGLCAPPAQAQMGLAHLSSGSSQFAMDGLVDSFAPPRGGGITLPPNLQPRIYVSDRKAAQYFTNAGRLEPGVAIYNDDGQMQCSAGHIVGDGRDFLSSQLGTAAIQGTASTTGIALVIPSFLAT